MKGWLQGILGKNWATSPSARWERGLAPEFLAMSGRTGCLLAMFCFLPIGVACCLSLSLSFSCCCCCWCFSTSGFSGPAANRPWISQRTRAHIHLLLPGHALRMCVLGQVVIIFQVTHTACGHVCYHKHSAHSLYDLWKLQRNLFCRRNVLGIHMATDPFKRLNAKG